MGGRRQDRRREREGGRAHIGGPSGVYRESTRRAARGPEQQRRYRAGLGQRDPAGTCGAARRRRDHSPCPTRIPPRPAPPRRKSEPTRPYSPETTKPKKKCPHFRREGCAPAEPMDTAEGTNKRRACVSQTSHKRDVTVTTGRILGAASGAAAENSKPGADAEKLAFRVPQNSNIDLRKNYACSNGSSQ